METVKTLVEALDAEIVSLYTRYSDLMKKFDTYRGKQLNEQTVEEVNLILKDIQDVWTEIHKAFYFIGERHPLAVQASQEHHSFIESIKKIAGIEDIKT